MQLIDLYVCMHACMHTCMCVCVCMHVHVGIYRLTNFVEIYETIGMLLSRVHSVTPAVKH